MCEPVSIAMGVMGVAQAASSARSAGKGAAAQAKANAALQIWRNDQATRAGEYSQKVADWQEENYKATAASQTGSLTAQYATVYERIDQMRDQALDQINEYSVEARDASATVAVAAAEAGTTGNSVRLARQQYEAQEARATYLSYKNVASQVRQSQREMVAMQAQAQNTVNRAMPGPRQPIDPAQQVQQIRSPSMAPYLIQGASSIVGAAAHYQSVQALTANVNTPTSGVFGDGVTYGPPAPGGN